MVALKILPLFVLLGLSTVVVWQGLGDRSKKPKSRIKDIGRDTRRK